MRTSIFGIPASAAALVLALAATMASASPAAYESRIVDDNLVGITVSNYGSIGNNFISRSPSLEYPLGTGYDHLTHGGLWIGGQSSDGSGAFTGVTTAIIDGFVGSSLQSYTEFTPVGSQRVRSNLLVSPYYDPDAVSEQDVISEFDDLTPKSTTGSAETHRPLGVQVQQRTYVWSYGTLAHIAFFHVVVRAATAPVSNVWVGWYTEFASGPKNAYSCWPPNAGCGPGSWYNKKWIQYDDALRLLREHRCDGLPAPANCHLDVTPPWIGLAMLTPPATGQHVTLAAWPFAPGSLARDTDAERYAIMSAGTVSPLTGDSLAPVTGDPVELLALGPFDTLAPGDSIVVDFAIVGGGQDAAEIQDQVIGARQLYAVGYTNPAVPVALSLVRAEPGLDGVRLEWFTPDPRGTVAMIERRVGQGAWSKLADVLPDGNGFIRYVDSEANPGGSYGYRLVINTIRSDEVQVEVPWAVGLAVRPVEAPVTSSVVQLRVSLPTGEPATVELLDVLGRRVARRTVDGGAGVHVVQLGNAASLAPGVYGVRLIQGRQTAFERVIVLR